MTIFVNETKCILGKNYKKANPKLTQKMTPNLTPNSTPKEDSRHDDICVSQRIEHLGGKCTK